MITGYHPQPVAEPITGRRFQLGPAIGAGFLTGLLLLIVPRGSPWSSLTFAHAAIMGRAFDIFGVPMALALAIHLALSLVYALLIGRAVAALAQRHAIIVGGTLGGILYLLNFGIVTALWPSSRGTELPVLFTHLVFGAICAGAYRGLLRRERGSPA